MNNVLYLYQTNSWLDNDASDNPLDDHFTFMAYNFMKYGLVNSVVFLRHDTSGRPDWKPENDKSLKFKEGSIDVLYKQDPIAYINEVGGGYVYFWGAGSYDIWDQLSRLDSKSFVLVNPMHNGIMHENYINPDIHHFIIPEGAGFGNCKLNATVPRGVPYAINHYTSQTFLERESYERVYDWIWVSSFDPQKSHLHFLHSLINTPGAEKLRGCIVGSKPWLGEPPYPKYEFHKTKMDNFNRVCDIVKKMSQIDIHLDVKLPEVKTLMSKSKFFVNLSELDSGPRAATEAALCGLPILTMPHIGAADLVIPSKTGEIIEDRSHAAQALLYMKEYYGEYDIWKNADDLKPDNVYPELIRKIKHQVDIIS